jgi:transposase InsO family protein
MDFFVVPTVTFRPAYVWFAIDHARRRILHCDTTDAPTAAWVVQQLRETFGLAVMPRHLIFDRDSIFSAQVVLTVKSFGIKPTRTAYRSPWQNGVAERWVGSVRRELLDHVVVWNERHLRSKWLYLNTLDSMAHLEKLVAFFVDAHNRQMPHSAFSGQTPDEMYFGTAANLPEELAVTRKKAREQRLAANRAASCDLCVEPD